MAAKGKATDVWKKNRAPRSRKESVLLTQDVIALSLEYFLIALVNQDIMVTAKVRALVALQAHLLPCEVGLSEGSLGLGP